MALAGIRSLHGFPRCPGPHLLSRYIGTWQMVKNQHGSGLPDEHLKSMFLNMLPEKVQAELVHRPELKTLQQTIDYVLLDIHRWSDRNIARVHEQHLNSNLHTGPKGHVMMLHGDGPEAPPASDVPSQPHDVAGKIDEIIPAKAAISTSRPATGRRPPPAPARGRRRSSSPRTMAGWSRCKRYPSRRTERAAV